MVRLTQSFLRRGCQVVSGEDPKSHRHIKHGHVKWRDYKSPFIDPPYWYKWSLVSPYSPVEQSRIREMVDVGWYRYNYNRMNYTPPEKWQFHVGDKVEILIGKDKGKQGEVVKVALVDPVDKRFADIDFRADDKGNRVRVSRRSGHIIPMPMELLYDGTPKCEYVEQLKDTPEKFALERTFVPSMKSPEEELRKIYKIQDPQKKGIFWY